MELERLSFMQRAKLYADWNNFIFRLRCVVVSSFEKDLKGSERVHSAENVLGSRVKQTTVWPDNAHVENDGSITITIRNT